MAKFMMDQNGRMRYGRWIEEIRNKRKMNQKDFAEKVIRYEREESTGLEVCKSFHRNSVGNWENGKNLPIDASTFISLALLEYDGLYLEKDKKSDEEIEKEMNAQEAESVDSADVDMHLSSIVRAKRYNHVEKRMKEYMGRRLYPRNLNDALLIETARGIYSFQELPEVRKKMNELVLGAKITREEKEALSLETATMNLKSELMGVSSRQEFERIVEKWEKYFYLGGRTVGERMKKIFEEKNPSAKMLDFKTAVSIYAPRYHDSFNRIFQSDICMSREWLLELCLRLHMDGEDIDRILDTAGMITLSEAEEGTGEFPKEYPKLLEYPLMDRFAYASLMAVSIVDMDIDMIPPMDYLYDFFWNNQGMELLKQLQKKVCAQPELLEEDAQIFLEKYETKFQWAIGEMLHEEFSDSQPEAYFAFRNEFQQYYSFPAKKGLFIENEEAIQKLHFMAAFTYTLFTGRVYDGNLQIEAQERLLADLGGKESDLYLIYLFMNNFWFTLLGKQKVYMDKEDRAYILINGKAKKKFGLDGVLEDLCASWSMILESTK